MVVELSGEGLTIAEIAEVARGGKVALTDNAAVIDRVQRSRQVIRARRRDRRTDLRRHHPVRRHGRQVCRPGAAGRRPARRAVAAQEHDRPAPAGRTSGRRCCCARTRCSRAHRASGSRSSSAIVTFLNAGAHPHVYQRGSIGASGDLVPLSYIGAAVLGLDPAFLVDMDGETLDSHAALARLGLEPLPLEPKEGLALNNGTGASTGWPRTSSPVRATWWRWRSAVHALFAQSMLATDQSFMPFIHAMKPHPGQVWTAAADARAGRGIEDHPLGNVGPACAPGRQADPGPLWPALPAAVPRPGRRRAGHGGAADRGRGELRQRQSADRPGYRRGVPHRQLPRPVHRRSRWIRSGS